LADEETQTLRIVVTVDEVPIGTLFTNTASNLNGTEIDPTPGNESASVEVRVVDPVSPLGCHPSPDDPDVVVCLSP
jgi:hypothetical protein